eukprot:15364359-Ditylum_brightwellii.AAC.2
MSRLMHGKVVFAIDLPSGISTSACGSSFVARPVPTHSSAAREASNVEFCNCQLDGRLKQFVPFCYQMLNKIV